MRPVRCLRPASSQFDLRKCLCRPGWKLVSAAEEWAQTGRIPGGLGEVLDRVLGGWTHLGNRAGSSRTLNGMPYLGHSRKAYRVYGTEGWRAPSWVKRSGLQNQGTSLAENGKPGILNVVGVGRPSEGEKGRGNQGLVGQAWALAPSRQSPQISCPGRRTLEKW